MGEERKGKRKEGKGRKGRRGRGEGKEGKGGEGLAYTAAALVLAKPRAGSGNTFQCQSVYHYLTTATAMAGYKMISYIGDFVCLSVCLCIRVLGKRIELSASKSV